MSLRSISYQEDYRSGYDDLLEAFYRPSLREAKSYWRAVGYFSSSALESFGSPLGQFIGNSGHIRLVTSVELSEEDIRAVIEGRRKEDVCERRIEQIIREEFADGVGDGVTRLTHLLELGRLEIRIAVPKVGTGIYHEKIGLFIDKGEDFVAFTGSSNESLNAFENNRECIDVYTSWTSPIRARRKFDHFVELWEGKDIGVTTFDFPEAARRQLLRAYRKSNDKRQPQSIDKTSKWRHQDQALGEFIKAERGILNMATGTGKTRTALKILQVLHAREEVDTTIITMDGDDLLDQWYRELLSLRADLETGIHLYRDFKTNKEVQDFNLSSKNSILLVSRAAGTTRDPLRSALRHLDSISAHRTLLIHDEVHRLGSPANRQRLNGLSHGVRYRLGLSATPDREYDDEGNRFIEDHIGPVLMTFGLDDAIRRGILSPFTYFPLSYDLTDDDRKRIRDVYRKKAARAAAGDPMSEEEVWIDIARIHKTSRSKLPLFDAFLETHPDLLKRCIIFVETQDYGYEVLDLIHKYRADFHTYFTGEQSETLKRFARGELECLVTCHRLSEGIDIQSLNTVILFSSSRAHLETIQRIGRCLRVDPSNPAKTANVVDFIRSSPTGGIPSPDEERRIWLQELAGIRPDGA